jgi:plasmid stabilization system protein ParE
VDRAQDIRARFIDGLKRLESFPLGCRPSTKIPHGRDLLFKGLPYVAPFVMAGQRVTVIAVYHSRQDWHL